MGSYSEQLGEGGSCLGGSMEVPAPLEKQDTLKIPFDTVLHEDHTRAGPGAHEEVWSLGGTAILPDMAQQDQSGGPSDFPQEEVPPMLQQRSDTITSSTVFVNPNDAGFGGSVVQSE